MSDTVENDSGLSAREVEEQLVQLSDADWARARRFANFLSRSVTGMGGDDLLQEAMTKLLGMERTWPPGLPPLVVLFNVMRSISDNELKKETESPIDAFTHVSTTDESPDGDHEGPFAIAVTQASPEDSLARRQLLEQIEKEVSEDEDAALLLVLWADGIRGDEAATELGWDKKYHDAARKRLARRLAPHEGQG